MEMGTARSRFVLLFWKKRRRSFDFIMMIVAAVKRVSSRATLSVLFMHMLGSGGVREISFVVIGHRSWRLPPMMRSPISECDRSARKYGTAFLWYVMRRGMKISSAAIAECVGPLWIWFPKSMSMSGIMERTRIVGMFGFVLRGFAVVLVMR